MSIVAINPRYDDRKGRIGSTSPSHRNKTSAIYQYESEEEEIDRYVDELEIDLGIEKKLDSKIGKNYLGGTDSYRNKGSNSYYVGNNSILELGMHTNTAVPGIAPMLTFRTSKGRNKGKSITGRTGSYPMYNPGNFRYIGTQYGTSRPHKLLTDIEDENIFNLIDLDDPMERSFKRQQNRIKRVLSVVKEYLSLDKTNY